MRSAPLLAQAGGWIFDLDGTLVEPLHDFAAIRRELGLPPGLGILEAIAELDAPKAAALMRRLDEIEYELAARAVPARGARRLLATLADRGVHLGILTRNSLASAKRTLRVAGLHHFFEAESVIAREHGNPKPNPHGIALLLRRWNCRPERAVMVGNHPMDVEAGRAAGTVTVYVGGGRTQEDPRASLCVGDLLELAAAL